MDKFNNVKTFLGKTKCKVGMCSLLVATSIPSLCYAAEGTGSIASTMTESFQKVVSETLAGIAAIAPIGITIFGAMFAWKKGKQFFNKVS